MRQLAQFAVDNGAHDGVVRIPLRQVPEEGGDGLVAGSAEDAAIGQEHFHGRSRDRGLEDVVFGLHHWPGLAGREGGQPCQARFAAPTGGPNADAQATSPRHSVVISFKITHTFVTHRREESKWQAKVGRLWDVSWSDHRLNQAEARSPRPEIRRKSEARNPKGPSAARPPSAHRCAPEPSEFGSRIPFGFRASDACESFCRVFAGSRQTMLESGLALAHTRVT